MNTKESPPGEARLRRQSKSPRRPVHTAPFKDSKAPRIPSPAQQPSTDKNDKGDSALSSGLATKEDSEKSPLLDHDLDEPNSDSQSVASVSQLVMARYTTEELLALRSSNLVQPPANFSPPGSQVKLPEMVPGGRNTKHSSALAYVDQENRTQKDVALAPQRVAGANIRTSGSSQRMAGLFRSTGMTANAGAVPTDGGTAETRSYGSRNNSVSMGSENVRANYGRSGSVAGAQAGMRHSISNDGGRLGATSWRSSGTARVVANGNGGSVAYPMALHGDDPAQPEWMADELTYDEGQSAKKMQDIEEWKRRMKEGGNAPDSHSDADQPTLAINEGAARGSRFLRMFSAPSALDPMLPVPGGPMHDMAVANAHTNGFEQQEGDSLSKLLKVFGNKVSVSNPVIDSRPSQGLPPGLAQQPTEAQAFADPAVQAAMMQMAQVSLEAPGNNPMQPAAASVLENGARSLSPASAGSGQRLKSASPAPINEALRGIVPTSVFRKSVQSSTASGGPKRPDSTTSSNRSATPARNLPSWLVELSRGRSSPSTEQALITNASLGTHDLVDTLERGFPALNTKPQHLDSQSISSLSVQASVGGPSEANAGSVRRSSIDTQGTERLADGTRTNSQAPTPEVLKGVPMIPEQPSSQEALLHPNAAMSPEPMQMQHGLAPPGMIGMPPQQQQQQQHMMLPDGTLLPGMVPPMGMMLPMGFHPNMMYGMMPPPGMFGGMPPVNVPMSQINSIPGPTNEHQQMMLMKMMMSDMPPPGMMFGQMGSGPQQMGPPPHLPPHMYSVGMAYPGMPASVPSSSEAGGAAQPTSQAFQQQQQQQQQFQHPRQQ